MKPSLVFIALWSAFYWCMVFLINGFISPYSVKYSLFNQSVLLLILKYFF
ncbi:hypothetical protein HPCPY1313_0131 [Helicobacter pylori CPY1313]|nr:hypothetical protein HPCPY1313_0131 [Helicobacter pylori CPY1313]